MPFLSYREKSDNLAYGARVYSQFTIYQGVFVHAEFQAANVYVSSEGERQWVMGLPLGAGYKVKLDDKMWLNGMVLWDVLHKEGYSPQKNPIFRVGVTYSL
jgi:hypothetical protein